MALLADGNAPSVEELQRYEAGVIEMANTEGIDLGAKVEIARGRTITELEELLSRNWSVRDLGITGKIVLTEPLRRWLAMEALAAAYGEARLNQVSERYTSKWNDYRRLAGEAKRRLMRAGVGVASSPLPRPGAANIDAIPGSVPAGTYFFRYSWVSGDGQEGEAGEAAAFALPSAGGVRVTPGSPPANAAGWNLYAGQTESETSLQNNAPLDVGENWDWEAGGLANGRGPGEGQAAEFYVTMPNLLQRG